LYLSNEDWHQPGGAQTPPSPHDPLDSSSSSEQPAAYQYQQDRSQIQRNPPPRTQQQTVYPSYTSALHKQPKTDQDPSAATEMVPYDFSSQSYSQPETETNVEQGMDRIRGHSNRMVAYFENKEAQAQQQQQRENTKSTYTKLPEYMPPKENPSFSFAEARQRTQDRERSRFVETELGTQPSKLVEYTTSPQRTHTQSQYSSLPSFASTAKEDALQKQAQGSGMRPLPTPPPHRKFQLREAPTPPSPSLEHRREAPLPPSTTITMESSSSPHPPSTPIIKKSVDPHPPLAEQGTRRQAPLPPGGENTLVATTVLLPFPRYTSSKTVVHTSNSNQQQQQQQQQQNSNPEVAFDWGASRDKNSMSPRTTVEKPGAFDWGRGDKNKEMLSPNKSDGDPLDSDFSRVMSFLDKGLELGDSPKGNHYSVSGLDNVFERIP